MTATVCGMGQLQSNPVRRTTLLLLVICGATFFAGLGRPAIGDSDEAFYAEAGREMVASGDWITPYYNYETRFQKPILFYWMVSASYLAAGVNESAARFGSALAGLGLALLTAACGRRWYDERTARLRRPDRGDGVRLLLDRAARAARPAARLLDHAGHLGRASSGLCDRSSAPGAGGCCWPARRSAWGSSRRDRWRSSCRPSSSRPICWLERRHVRLPPAAIAGAAAVAAAVAAPWFIAMARIHGTPLPRGLLRRRQPRTVCHEPVQRSAAALVLPADRRRRPAAVDAADAVRRRAADDVGDAGAGGRRAVTRAADRLGRAAARCSSRRRSASSRATSCRSCRRWRCCSRERSSGGSLPVTDGATPCVRAAASVHRRAARRARRRCSMRALPLIVMIAPALVIASAGAIIAAGHRCHRAWRCSAPLRHIGLGVGIAGAVTLAGLQYGLSPAGRDPVQDMAALVVQHRQRDEPIATYRVFVRNLVFYTGIKQERPLRSRRGARVPPLAQPGAGRDCRRRPGADRPRSSTSPRGSSGEVLYFNASAVKLRTLLRPDPGQGPRSGAAGDEQVNLGR